MCVGSSDGYGFVASEKTLFLGLSTGREEGGGARWVGGVVDHEVSHSLFPVLSSVSFHFILFFDTTCLTKCMPEWVGYGKRRVGRV